MTNARKLSLPGIGLSPKLYPTSRLLVARIRLAAGDEAWGDDLAGDALEDVVLIDRLDERRHDHSQRQLRVRADFAADADEVAHLLAELDVGAADVHDRPPGRRVGQ